MKAKEFEELLAEEVLESKGKKNQEENLSVLQQERIKFAVTIMSRKKDFFAISCIQPTNLS